MNSKTYFIKGTELHHPAIWYNPGYGDGEWIIGYQRSLGGYVGNARLSSTEDCPRGRGWEYYDGDWYDAGESIYVRETE